MPPRPLCPEDLWRIPRVGNPEPARDGSFAVVPVTEPDVDRNETRCRLWWVSLDGGAPRPLTSPDLDSREPAVDPTGRRLAFVRAPGTSGGDGAATGRHGDRPQLYRMALDGGEPERLTDLPLGVTQPIWFPDGRRVAFLAPVLVEAPDPEATARELERRTRQGVSAHVTEDRVYRYWDRWLTDGRVHHLFALDCDSGALLDLTPGSTHWLPFMDRDGHVAIAPDGREIAWTAQRSDPPYDPLVFGVFAAAVPERLDGGGDAAPIRLVTKGHEGPAFRPAYSPDGRWLVYGLQRELDFYADRQRIAAIDRSSGQHHVLTEDWDVDWASEWAFGDGAELFLTAEVAGRKNIYALDVAAAAADPAARVPREVAGGAWHGPPRPAGGRVFATLQTLDRPPEVVAYDPADGGCVFRTRFTAEAMEPFDLGAVEEITVTGAGDDPVQVFLVRPPASAASGAGPEARLPLVHLVHGGPHGSFGDQWHWRWNAQVFAAAGYLVALVNFHGSSGWGEGFTSSILGRWGDQPYVDILAATDALVDRRLVDERRMAAAGGSYGGYLVSWIASQTDRFACLVNHAGVSDFQTQYASDVTQGRNRSMGGEPWDRIEAMDRYNPMRHADGFASPMLVLHGLKDYRVPSDQSLAVYNVYKAKGLPARLVVYPDENHWILKPRNSLHWYGEVLGWLERWLGPSA